MISLYNKSFDLVWLLTHYRWPLFFSYLKCQERTFTEWALIACVFRTEKKKNHMASRYSASTRWITLFRIATLCANHVQKISLMRFPCFAHMQCYLVTLACQSTFLFVTIRPQFIHHYGHIFVSLYLQKGPGHASSFQCWKKCLLTSEG